MKHKLCTTEKKRKKKSPKKGLILKEKINIIGNKIEVKNY